MSQYKVLPSYGDLTSFGADMGPGPLMFSAHIGGDRLLDLDTQLQVCVISQS